MKPIRIIFFINSFLLINILFSTLIFSQENLYKVEPIPNIGVSISQLPGSFYYPCGYPENLIFSNAYFPMHPMMFKDNGETFIDLQKNIPDVITCGIEDKFNPNILYITCAVEPFMKSEDGGTSWKKINPFGDDAYGERITQDAEGTLYILVGRWFKDYECSELWVSNDKGENWERVNVRKGRMKFKYGGIFGIWADPVIPKVLYVDVYSDYFRCFMVSEDGGKNFKRREKGLPHRPDGYLPPYGFPLGQSSSPPYTIYYLYYTKKYYFYGGEKKGAFIYSSDNRGRNWKRNAF
ncbi:MAG: WD40/YVTN/BNR-like repeat-containing protein [Acidobacteriota bacterium]